MPDDNEEITVLPEIYLLEQILNMIAAGELRVPKFQRPFVCDQSRCSTSSTA